MENFFYGINLNTPDDKEFLTGHNLITIWELILAHNFYTAHSNDTHDNVFVFFAAKLGHLTISDFFQRYKTLKLNIENRKTKKKKVLQDLLQRVIFFICNFLSLVFIWLQIWRRQFIRNERKILFDEPPMCLCQQKKKWSWSKGKFF
jgi:hypothetical protein